MSTVRIDLTPYTTESEYMGFPYRTEPGRYLPRDGAAGRKAAIAEGFAEKLQENDVVVLVVNRNTDISRKNQFMESFFKVGLKAVGVEELKKKLAVRDEEDDFYLAYVIREFIEREEKRLARLAEKKRKEDAKDDPENWTEPMHLFVPDIGTVIRLTDYWGFRLYQEYRNAGIIELMGLFEGQSNRPWQERGPLPLAHLRLKPGAELTVDRIYVRQGAGEYSSLSFWVEKGAVIEELRNPRYDGSNTIKKRTRFWVKLIDANRIKGLVSIVTLPKM